MENSRLQGFRLSPQQEHIWLLGQGDEHSPYFAQLAVLIEGDPDKEALLQALQNEVDRHEILRTTFHCLQDMTLPVQVISESAQITIKDYDIHNSDLFHHRALIDDIAEMERGRARNFQEQTPLQLTLIRLDPRKQVLLITLPAVCADSQTLHLFAKNVARAYGNYAGKREASDEVMQYADLAEWQNELLESDTTKEGRAFWRKQEFSYIAAKLPYEHSLDRPGAFAPQSVSQIFDQDALARIEEFVQHYGTSTANFFFACWQILLWRITGRMDLIIGVYSDGRTLGELESALGPLGKYIPILAHVDKKEIRFDQLLGQLESDLQQALEWQHFFCWDDVRDSAGNDLAGQFFEYCFDFTPPVNDYFTSDVSFSPFSQYVCQDRFKLKLSCIQTDVLTAGFHYDSALLNELDVFRLSEELKTLVSSVLDDPERAVADLEIIGQSERHLLLCEFNKTAIEYPTIKPIHNLFEDQVRKTPDRIAVVFEDDQLTYAELNTRANRLAHHLRGLGIDSEARVGICLERSIEMVVALLAILKSGAAYIPLDPGYPEERLAFFLEDSKVSTIITISSLATLFKDSKRHILCLDTHSDEIGSRACENPELTVDGQQLAYVIYTSGSTGKPKGVMVPHDGVVNCLHWMQQEYRLDETDRFMLKTALGFDPSVWEIFWTLSAGAAIVIARPDGHLDTHYLVESIRRNMVTSIYFVPSMLRFFLEQGKSGSSDSLKRVICGGEALPVETMSLFFHRLYAELHHSYGPTEASIAATESTCDVDRPITIGRPLGNVQIYILDPNMKLTPIGVPGEVYIGGAGLARGYLDRQDLTAELFVINPFDGQTGSRLYKTGDLARYSMNGDIEFLGRVDDQVKIRGYRVEPGEIESVLRQHSDVSDAIVLVTDRGSDGKRLEAYLSTKENKKPGNDVIRRYLQTRLPEYMVPAILVVLDTLPLLANGKVDRKALAALSSKESTLEQNYVAPRNLVEEALAVIWSEVLGFAQIGIHDNFFALGGDSIKSVPVVALAKERGFNISIRQLFQHQTIYDLAQSISTNAPAGIEDISPVEAFELLSEEDLLTLPDDLEDAYPLTMLQLGMIYHMELTPDDPAYHNVNSWYLRAPFDEAAFKEAVSKIVDRHSVMRTSFDLTRYSVPLQLVHKKVPLPLRVEDIRNLEQEAQEQIIGEFLQREIKQSLDISNPPLLRYVVHRRTDETFQFSLVECHAIMDGWSTTSTLAEIFEYYFALLKKEALPDVTPPSISYRDYVRLEQHALQSEEYRSYWKKKLDGCAPIRLARSHSAQPIAGRRGRCLYSTIPIDVVERVKNLARIAKVPVKSVLLAAHLKVMSMLSNQNDVLTGLVTNGRPEQLDGEKVRGLFLNTLPFRLNLSGGTWNDLVRKTFEAELDLLPFRRYPMAAIQREWGERQLFEAVFNYLSFHSTKPLAQSGDIERLGSEDLSITNFTLSTTFTLDPVSQTLLVLAIDYDITQLTDNQVKKIESYYHQVLRSMTDEPSSYHHYENLLPRQEQVILLEDWNQTASDYSRNLCTHELIAKEAELNPDRVAVCHDGKIITYGELNIRANQLAHFLIEKGVCIEDRVGIYMNRSVEMVISMLGILKAGGAYLPLDPLNPDERIESMIEDAQARIVLTGRQVSRAAIGQWATTICLDNAWKDISNCKASDPAIDITAGNMAYVIYTSGSTGISKGVEIEHGGLLNLLFWHNRVFDISPLDRATQLARMGFDASVWEIWPYLVAGASVHIVDEEICVWPLELRDWLARHEITISFMPTPLAEMTLNLEWPAKTTLRTLLTGGDRLGSYPATALPFNLVNNYGPTENAVVATSGAINNPGLSIAPSIGRPIFNNRIYILDRNLQPLPEGIYGEIHIAGDSLARCYSNRPDVTGERFIPNSFSGEPGARLYKTGDIARYLGDGNIEFRGRSDRQVKFHGYRIELGEVEAVLLQRAEIREAVVLLREDKPGDERLVAYVSQKNGSILTDSDLRNTLKRKLPVYMIPSAFVLLETMPRSPNGKIDENALLQIKSSLPDPGHRYVPPRTMTEMAVVEVWQEILDIQKIGLEDNFFDLGGDSIRVIRVFSKLREILKEEFSITDMFQYPTVDSFVNHLINKSSGESVPNPADDTTRIEQGSERFRRLRQAQRAAREA